MPLSGGSKNRGVIQLFDSVNCEEELSDSVPALKQFVEGEAQRLNGDGEAKKKLERTGFTTTKERLCKSIASKEKQIAGWKAHLSDHSRLKIYSLSERRTFHGSDHLPR